ncbi:MAG: PilZ domain-containing protein [Chloroflexi bacterium]|nr:PilZ domain-containing protein [Chloroflexota bacterium]
MAAKERRRAPRGAALLLTSFRCLEKGEVTWSGFARTLNIGESGALLESPDRFRVDQLLILEFLMDNDQLLEIQGVVKRVEKSRNMYQVAVAFPKLTAKAKRLLAKQAAAI